MNVAIRVYQAKQDHPEYKVRQSFKSWSFPLPISIEGAHGPMGYTGATGPQGPKGEPGESIRGEPGIL